MKRIISLILILMLILSLAACNQTVPTGGTLSSSPSQNNDNKSSATQSDGQNPSSDSPSSGATAPVEKGPMGFDSIPDKTAPGRVDYKVNTQISNALKKSGKVEVYTFGTNDVKDDFVSYFESQYGAELTLNVVSWPQYPTEFLNNYASASAADVVCMPPKLWPKAAMINLVYSISELKKLGVKGLDHPVLTDSNAINKTATAYKGQVYGIGTRNNLPNVMLVNNELLATCGVTKTPSDYYEEGDWTYDNFLKICKQIASVDKNYDNKPDYDAYSGWDSQFILQMKGVQLISVNSSGLLVNNIDSAGVKSAMQMIRDLDKNGYATMQNNFFRDGQAMLVAAADSISSTVSTLYSNMGASYAKKYSIVPLPEVTKGKSVSGGYYCAFAVCNATNNPQGAVNYIIAHEIYKQGLKRDESKDLSVWLNDEGDRWFADLSKKTTPIVFDCIGTLYNEQWLFWSDIKSQKIPLDEAINNFKNILDAQIALENSRVS